MNNACCSDLLRLLLDAFVHVHKVGVLQVADLSPLVDDDCFRWRQSAQVHRRPRCLFVWSKKPSPRGLIKSGLTQQWFGQGNLGDDERVADGDLDAEVEDSVEAFDFELVQQLLVQVVVCVTTNVKHK